jgi:hypothetical protein
MEKSALLKKLIDTNLFIRKIEDTATELNIDISNDKLYLALTIYKKALLETLNLTDDEV